MPMRWLVVDADGAVLDEATVLPAGSSVYLYRELPDEVPVPFDVPVLVSRLRHRGGRQAALFGHYAPGAARRADRAGAATPGTGTARAEPGAIGRDRLTAGVLLFTARREVRGAYQTLFARGVVRRAPSGAGGHRSGPGAALRAPKPHRQTPRAPAGGLRAGSAQRRDAGGAGIGRRVPADATHRTHPPAAGAHDPCSGCRSRVIRCIPTSLTWQLMTSARRCGCWHSASSSTIRSPGHAVSSSAAGPDRELIGYSPCEDPGASPAGEGALRPVPVGTGPVIHNSLAD